MRERKTPQHGSRTSKVIHGAAQAKISDELKVSAGKTQDGNAQIKDIRGKNPWEEAAGKTPRQKPRENPLGGNRASNAIIIITAIIVIIPAIFFSSYHRSTQQSHHSPEKAAKMAVLPPHQKPPDVPRWHPGHWEVPGVGERSDGESRSLGLDARAPGVHSIFAAALKLVIKPAAARGTENADARPLEGLGSVI